MVWRRREGRRRRGSNKESKLLHGVTAQFLRCCFAVWLRLAQTCAKTIRRVATVARSASRAVESYSPMPKGKIALPPNFLPRNETSFESPTRLVEKKEKKGPV